MADEQEVKPGYYECKLNGYGGHIQFPYPLMWPQIKLWWEQVITPLKDLEILDFGYTDLQWQGAKTLLLDYGEWKLTGDRVTPGDVKEDNVPAKVVSFVVVSAKDYIPPFLVPRLQRLLRTTL